MSSIFDDDGLPMDEVGVWAKEKHERLRQYIDITRDYKNGNAWITTSKTC